MGVEKECSLNLGCFNSILFAHMRVNRFFWEKWFISGILHLPIVKTCRITKVGSCGWKTCKSSREGPLPEVSPLKKPSTPTSPCRQHDGKQHKIRGTINKGFPVFEVSRGSLLCISYVLLSVHLVSLTGWPRGVRMHSGILLLGESSIRAPKFRNGGSR